MAVPQEYTETLKLLAAGVRVTVGKSSWKMTDDVCDTPACKNGGNDSRSACGGWYLKVCLV